MSGLSDTLTVGLVLVLLFGSIALYLYTRIQQNEQKISLLESILLDLKMSGEVKEYTEPPALETRGVSQVVEYTPFTTDEYANSKQDIEYDAEDGGIETSGMEGYSSIIDGALKEMDDDSSSDDIGAVPIASKVSVNYESMTLQELKQLAKDKGISGVSTMKKGQILEALKTVSRATGEIESGSIGSNDITSFLESSAPIDGSLMVDA